MLPFAGKNRVTSPFGTRPLNGTLTDHKGIDIVGEDSRDVLAVCGGKVVQSTIVTDRANRTWEWGNYVCVQTQDGMLHYYCHMDSRAAKSGDTLQAGDIIGVMGATGYSLGAHLHFEVRNSSKVSVDPCPTLGIPNEPGTYTVSRPSPRPQPQPRPQTRPAGRVLRVFGGKKGLNVEAFTGKDVELVAKKNAVNIRVEDGSYKIIAMEGSAGGYQWCQINYKGQALYMPYGGVLDDRCKVE